VAPLEHAGSMDFTFAKVQALWLNQWQMISV